MKGFEQMYLRLGNKEIGKGMTEILINKVI
jgi:hypothetical protein